MSKPVLGETARRVRASSVDILCQSRAVSSIIFNQFKERVKVDGWALAFHCSFTLFLILPSRIAHPRFDMDAYCAELYREAGCRLWMVRTGLLRSGRGICDARMDGIALLDIAWGLHDQK